MDGGAPRPLRLRNLNAGLPPVIQVPADRLKDAGRAMLKCTAPESSNSTFDIICLCGAVHGPRKSATHAL